VQGIEREHKKNSILVLRGLFWGGDIVRLKAPTDRIILKPNETLTRAGKTLWGRGGWRLNVLRRQTMGKDQLYGENPIAQRKTDLYKKEYVHSFVKKWDELIDWDARVQSEGDFFINLMKERGVRKVLDVATGTGFHSIRLLKAGFDVTSADGSPEMLAQAFENGRRAGFIMKTIHADWRWLIRDIHTQYDAVICLGNSLTHLFSEQDRRKALAEFYSTLNHDGVLILDQRNYDGMLDNGFTSKHVYYYCGENVSAEPEYVDEGLARFRY